MKEFGKIIVVIFCFAVVAFLSYGESIRRNNERLLRELQSGTFNPNQNSSGSTVNVYENEASSGGNSMGAGLFPLMVAAPIWAGAYSDGEENNVNASRSTEINQYDHNGNWNRSDSGNWNRGDHGDNRGDREGRGRGGRGR